MSIDALTRKAEASQHIEDGLDVSKAQRSKATAPGLTSGKQNGEWKHKAPRRLPRPAATDSSLMVGTDQRDQRSRSGLAQHVSSLTHNVVGAALEITS